MNGEVAIVGYGYHPPLGLEEHTIAGRSVSMLANRISYHFNLMGLKRRRQEISALSSVGGDLRRDRLFDPAIVPPVDRIHEHAVHQQGEVHVIAERQTGGAAPPDHLAP